MKTLLPGIALMFLLLLPLFGQAQEVRISGRVVDAKTKEPISFASISLRNLGIGLLTNEQGEFQVAGSKSIKQDSIVVMTLGYERYAAFIESNSSNSLTIELIRRNVEGIRLICRKLTDKDLLSSAKAERLAEIASTRYAFFIGNDKRKQTREILAVSFYVGRMAFRWSRFAFVFTRQTQKPICLPSICLVSRFSSRLPKGASGTPAT